MLHNVGIYISSYWLSSSVQIHNIFPPFHFFYSQINYLTLSSNEWKLRRQNYHQITRLTSNIQFIFNVSHWFHSVEWQCVFRYGVTNVIQLTSVSSKIGLSLESIELSFFKFVLELPASIQSFFQSPSVKIDLVSIKKINHKRKWTRINEKLIWLFFKSFSNFEYGNSILKSHFWLSKCLFMSVLCWFVTSSFSTI